MRSIVLEPGEALLTCPNCGFEYIHIDRVEMLSAGGRGISLEARGEDDHANIRVQHSIIQYDPAERRHTVRLHGYCEGCPVDWHIDLIQHKGVTNVRVTVAEFTGMAEHFDGDGVDA